MTSIPASAVAIDAPWLEGALAARYPGVRVASVEVSDRSEMTNSHARLRAHYDEPAGAPEQLFCKMLPAHGVRREQIATTGMGPREVRFYSEIAPSLSMRVPTAHVALHDGEDFAFILLLEDLADTGCTISDGRVGLTPDAAARALEDLADLHVRFSDPARRKRDAAWVPPPMESDYGSQMLQIGLERHRDKLTDRYAELAALYIAHRSRLHALWQEGPQTVIHGDPHIGNLFDDHGRTGFLDWGIINVSTPLRDVSYLLVMALSVEDRRANERALLKHYLAVQQAQGGFDLDFDAVWLAHRIHAAYAVPASCQIVTFPENITPAREIFAQAFLGRAEAVLEDLDVREALRDAAGI